MVGAGTACRASAGPEDPPRQPGIGGPRPEYGFEKEHGGGVYRCGYATQPASNRDMEWWQQMEALVAFLNACQLTGDPKYWQAFNLEPRSWDRFVDHQYGEVYTAIFQNGKIDDEKAGPWKAPYHVTRACLEIISRQGGTL
jgi:cellobiose epimerase